MNFVEYIRNPRRLLLVWQAAEAPRVRQAVAELVQADVRSPAKFRYLTGTPDFDEACAAGFIHFPAFRKTTLSYDLGVIETFMRRLPPSSRGDYAKYLEQFRLRPESPISEMALLAYTGAKLPSDGFSIIDPLEDMSKSSDVLIEVAGFRHTSAIARDDLIIGARARLQEEPDNPHDPNAMAVYIDSERIGHVPRQQAPALRALARNDAVELFIERVNGQPQRPLVYLFAKIRPRVVARDLLQG